MPDKIGALREIESVVEFLDWVTGGGSVVFLSLITGCIEGGEVAKNPPFLHALTALWRIFEGEKKELDRPSGKEWGFERHKTANYTGISYLKNRTFPTFKFLQK